MKKILLILVLAIFCFGFIYQTHNTSAMKDGYGTLTYPDGSKYVGNFSNGKFDGYGTTITPDGIQYVGNYVNGLLNGYGTMYDPNGNIIKQGYWKNNIFVGD